MSYIAIHVTVHVCVSSLIPSPNFHSNIHSGNKDLVNIGVGVVGYIELSASITIHMTMANSEVIL